MYFDFIFFLFSCNGYPLDLHVLTLSFPTLRSSDLCVIRALRIPAPTSGRMCHRQRGRIIICPTPCPPKRKCRSSKQSRDSTTITGLPTPPRSREIGRAHV